ncbi:MAG: division/cell wall cluster transcriptional repressor MraZ [Desulfuromonadales bacterium]|nr:division/cell wall cluster transcriptional repressor MraZ [Desulfuromonadales bacterium]
MSDRDAIFGGENLSSIDSKGRTCIPAKFREAMVTAFGDERFVITKAQPINLGDSAYARGLSVFPLNVWSEIKRKALANEGGFTSKQLDSIKRQFLNPAEECVTDKLGRVLIPPSLRVHAKLERELWFVGMDRRFDIWSKDTYDRVNDQDEQNLPDDLTAIGF